MTVAVLYVEPGGVYYGLEDVDPWDEERGRQVVYRTLPGGGPSSM